MQKIKSDGMKTLPVVKHAGFATSSFERMSDSFISRQLREETLRRFYFIIKLPADEGGRSHSIVIPVICLM